ncbi:MAG: YggS family pyridoxal phosphate-dependent enzyme [Thermomicrobiales bacterium]|nr:YggS family pyridoxal phosphate-dependent enzyme [Thermomicrobiales bacterium]
MGLAERIGMVRAEVAEAAARAGRSPDAVTIVAVSKTVDRAAVDEAYALGLRHFGENRVQDAVRKFADPLPHDAVLHLIGQLQTNKARPAAALFGLIESVDRLSLIAALEKEAARLERTIPVLLQVNIAGEAQKAGCPPEDAADLVARIAATPGLALRGLMTIAPLVPDPEQVRPVFAGLRALRDLIRDEHPELPLATLSMGMSNDYATAIAEGATEVRIGRAIFGS